MTEQDFQIAIVGGGIVGLVCAIALAKKDIHVDLFEAAVRTYIIFIYLSDFSCRPSMAKWVRESVLVRQSFYFASQFAEEIRTQCRQYSGCARYFGESRGK
jgi:thioredoxin reductase